MSLSLDPLGFTPPPSSPYAHIRCALGVQLSQGQLALLAQAFKDSSLIFIKREFRSGYSGAVVLLVSLGADQAPVVVKLAHPFDLEREYQPYQQFVRQISPQNIAHLRGEPLLSVDDQLGLIQYSFAGGESHQAAARLKDYYETNGGAACAAVLNRIFRAYGRYWWANNRPELFTLGEHFDHLLPVHLQVAPSKAVETPLQTLESAKTSFLTLRELQVGDHIRLIGFRLMKVQEQGRELTLVAQPPPNEAAAMLRIRLQLGADAASIYKAKPGERMDQLDVVVTATRHSLLCAAATEAVPTFDPKVEAFTADIGAVEGAPSGAWLLNPLYDLSGLLDHVVETKVSIIHGDLNLQNILVDIPTGFAWLVDFSETRRGPTPLDLQRLEAQVLTKLLTDLMRQAGVRPAIVANLLYTLHADPLPSVPPHPGLQEPFQVLVTIRRLARQYLIDDLDWDEYYQGLIVTLVGALKYKEFDTFARTLALTAAATLQGLLGHHLETNQLSSQLLTASTSKSGSSVRLAAMSATMVVVLAVVAAIWQFQPAPITPEPTATLDPTSIPTAVSGAVSTVPTTTATMSGTIDMYYDDISPGWEYWSWDIRVSNDNTEVHNGSAALRVEFTEKFGGLSFRALTLVDGTKYQAVDFWIYNAEGDSQLDLYTMTGDEDGVGPIVTFSVPAGVWTHKVVPLAELGNPAQIARLNWQEASGNDDAVFYFDDIRLIAISDATLQHPAPTQTTVAIRARMHMVTAFLGVHEMLHVGSNLIDLPTYTQESSPK